MKLVDDLNAFTQRTSGRRNNMTQLLSLLESARPVSKPPVVSSEPQSPQLPNAGMGHSSQTLSTKSAGGLGGLDAFIRSIAGQESGGNYGAVGIPTKYGKALGKYQILDSNLRGDKRGWDYEALGRDVTPEQYLKDPKTQEAIARYKLSQYFTQFGPEGAAKAWYAGPAAAKKSSNKKNNNGKFPSINEYAAAITRRMAKDRGA